MVLWVATVVRWVHHLWIAHHVWWEWVRRLIHRLWVVHHLLLWLIKVLLTALLALLQDELEHLELVLLYGAHVLHLLMVKPFTLQHHVASTVITSCAFCLCSSSF